MQGRHYRGVRGVRHPLAAEAVAKISKILALVVNLG